VLGADFVIEALVIGAALAIDGVRGAPVQFQHYAQLGERIAYVAFVPRFHGGAMNLLFLLTEFLIFLLLAVDLRQQLQRTCLLGPELKNILQSLAACP